MAIHTYSQSGRIGETAALEKSKIVPNPGSANIKVIATSDATSWSHRRVCSVLSMDMSSCVEARRDEAA
jgi:hypothetical protein